MWILQVFKESLNATFNFFLQKVKGRFVSFMVQLVVSYLAVAIATLLITMIVIPILNQGQFSLDLFSLHGLFAWVRMVDPAWTVTVVIASNFLFTSNLNDRKMSFPDFYTKKSSNFWLDLSAAIVVLSLVLIVYYKNELLLSSADKTPLELLLSEGGMNLGFTVSSLISSWISYIVIVLPIFAIVLIDVRERKRMGVQEKIPIGKAFLALVIISFTLAWTFDGFLYAFNELVLTLFYIPFEMIEIPAFFGIIATIFFKVFHFMTLAAVVHFVLAEGTKETYRNPNQDILDEI